MELSRLMDPMRSRAVPIAAGHYGPAAELDELETVATGVAEFRRLLTDPARGGLEPSACRFLVDPAYPSDVDDELVRCAREADDTLLIYYSGHGVPDPDDGSLYLAVNRTDRNRLYATALPIGWVRRAVRDSNARTKVIILDCCFSGRAISAMSPNALAAEADIEGSFVLAATASNVLALAPPGERFTAFTGALLEVLARAWGRGWR